MTSPAYDLALGVQQESLNAGLKKVYDNHPDAISGEHSQIIDGTAHSFTWKFLAAPQVILAKPDPEIWSKSAKSVDADGRPLKELPADGVVQLHSDKMNLKCKIGDTGASVEDSAVTVTAQLRVADGGITVQPLGVWFQKLPADGNDATMLRRVITPAALKFAAGFLTGLKLPVSTLFGQQISLTPVRIDIARSQLVVASSTSGQSGSGTFDWPTGKQVFALISPELLKTLVGSAVNAKRNTTIAKGDKTLIPIGSITWDVKFLGVDDITIDASDRTKGSGATKIAYQVRANAFATSPGGGCALAGASHDM